MKKPPSIGVRLGALIRERRIAKGLSQARLAQIAGMPDTGLCMIETGRRAKRMNLDAMQRIAHALGFCSLASMIRRAEGGRQ